MRPPRICVDPLGQPRSVLFLHSSYYHFFYLAAALRRRGWDAVYVSMEPPDSPNARFYHGEDVNLFEPDPRAFAVALEAVLAEIPERFRMVHFAGDGWMTLSPADQDFGARREAIPWDFIHLRRAGVKIGYTCGGCADGIAQSSFYRWSEQSCDKCTLKGRDDRCSDLRNLAWGHKREMFCDLIATEMLPSIDYASGPKVYREPLTMALDANTWRPDIAVPPEHRIERSPEEVLVYHGVGNYFDANYGGNRDYKGTLAIRRAVDHLRSEGLPVRLIFVHDLPSTEVRFVQVQADLVVDQLNFGRYGANGRESLMLGKPVIGNVRLTEADGASPLQSLSESPIIHATEATIEAVLRDLVLDADKRRRVGDASRAYALKWHSAHALAERYEVVYDWLMSGGRPSDAPVVVAGAQVGG